MKVAFVIPFAFEKFFHDKDVLRNSPDKFEDEVISRRNTWHFNWCNAMRNAGMDVTVYHISMFGKLQREYLHYTGIKIIRVPADFKSRVTKSEYSLDLLRRIKVDNPDIVFSVTHIFPPVLDMYDLLAFYCRLIEIPIVTRNAYADSYLHIFPGKKVNTNGSWFRKFRRFALVPLRFSKRYIKFRIKRLSLKITSCTLTQTDEDYHSLANKFKIPVSHLKPFPKPINLDLFYEINKKEAADKLGFDLNASYILHVSNLFDTKGCEHIINILPDLLKENRNIYLLVVGDGPKQILLRNLTLNAGVQDNVFFIGQVDHKDLVYYYNLSDVFVLPTEIDVEGQPNVIIESIACNTYPVSSLLPGPSAIVKEGLGKLIDPCDYNQLKKVIINVLEGNIAIDQPARSNLLDRYSLQNVGNELNSLFSEYNKKNSA